VLGIRSKGAPASSLYSQGACSEEGVADGDVARVRIFHLDSDSAQHVDSSDEGASTLHVS